MATTRLPAPLYRRLSWAALGVLCTAGAQAQEVPDPSRFQVTPPAPAAPAGLGLRGSVGLDQFDRRRPEPGASATLLRGVADYRREWGFGPAGRLTLSDRAETLVDEHGDSQVRNALREAYGTLRFGPSLFADLGRLNLRSGVASGFNPTDWLREGAALPQTSQNPASLRENRLGTFMLRLQALQDWGSVHVAAIPRLAEATQESSSYGFAWGRTNSARAVHVRVAPRLSEDVSVDLLGYAREGRHPQWGMNLTAVPSDAWIAHAELAAGTRAGLRAPGPEAAPEGQRRMAAGLSWTTSQGATLTLERHLATDALDAADWDSWRTAEGAGARKLAQLRARRSDAQDPLVRDAWFARAAITGAGPDANVDLSAFARLNPHDRSYLWQVDAAWHVLPRSSLYASVGGFSGAARTEYGANATRSLLSVRFETVY
jgi:hypothetical protein